MPPNRFSDADLLELAEDIAADRRTLSNVIDQIAAAEPDDAARRHAVSELQSMVMALTAVRRHARATAEARLGSPAAPVVSESLVVEPASLKRRPRPPVRRGPGSPRLVLGTGTALLAVAVVAFLASSIRSTPPLSGGSALPSASPMAASAAPSESVTAKPSESSVPSPATPGPATPLPSPTAIGAYLIPKIPTEPLAGASRVAFSWASSPTLMHLWTWDPATDDGLKPWFDVDVDLAGTFYNDNVSVLVSPDGTRVAVNEHGFTDLESRDRVRVFDATGTLLWTSATGAAPVIDMAWSPDGTELALGSVPVPWVVLTFSEDGSIDSTTYDLPGDNAYRLLGFAPDNAHLIGYESSGEAEFWEKPAALDLARGTIVPIDVFPTGMQSNATERDSGVWQPLERIDTETGAVLARTGGAKEDPEWVVRRGTDERPVGIDPDRQAVWGAGSHVVSVGATSSPPVRGFWNDAIGATSQPVMVMPEGAWPALLSVRGGDALSLLKPPIAGPGGDLGWSEAVLVDLGSGRTAVVLAPGENSLGGLHFAGWLPPSP